MAEPSIHMLSMMTGDKLILGEKAYVIDDIQSGGLAGAQIILQDVEHSESPITLIYERVD